MKYYTYLHRRVDTNEIFYVGKGSGRRAWSKGGRNKYWNAVVKGIDGFNVEIVARWETERQSLDHEVFLIWCFRQMGIKIVNQTDGGEGITIKNNMFVPKKRGPMSEEHKQRIREGTRKRWQDLEHKKNQTKARKGRVAWNKGIILPEDIRQKIANGNKNKKYTDEHREQISRRFKGRIPWNKGIKYSEYFKDKE